MFGALAGLVLGLKGYLGATVTLRPPRVLREGQLALSPHWLTLPCGARLGAADPGLAALRRQGQQQS